MKNLLFSILLLFSTAARAEYIHFPMSGVASWRTPIATSASLPGSGNTAGDCIAAQDSGLIYCWDGAAWQLGSGGSGVTTIAAFGSVPNSNGGSIAGVTLTLQPADATHPGGVTTGTQTIAGAKTFSGTTTFASGSISSSAWNTGTSTFTSNGVAFTAKAPSASPTFTGTVTLPSGSVTSSAWDTGTSTFTSNGVAFTAKAPSASPTFTGTVNMPSGSISSSAWDTGTSGLTSNGIRLDPVRHSDGSSGSALTIDLSQYQWHAITLTANCTFTFTGAVSGTPYLFELIQNGSGPWTVTWPVAVDWGTDGQPALSGINKTDMISLPFNGTSYFGAYKLGF